MRIDVPLLDRGVVLEPNSFKLVFNLVIETGKDTNHAVFNVSRNLVDKFSVKFGTHLISEIERYDLYEGYHDLLTKQEDMMMGIMDIYRRKVRAGTSDKSTNAKTVMHCNEYGNLYSISLSHPILDDYGCFYSGALKDKIEFTLHLAKKGDIVITSDNTKAHSFKLENIFLEYTSIRNSDLVSSISSLYENGKYFYFDDIHLHNIQGPINFTTQKTFRTIVNMNVQAMKGVLFLFTKTYVAGARDTEEFINPLLTSVKVTINGVPNSLYSEEMKSIHVWKDLLKKVGKVHNKFEEDDFRFHKYALWVDLRMAYDNMLHGDGRALGTIGGGMVIDVTSKSTETSVNCHIFTVSDATLFVQNGRVKHYNV